MSGNDTVNFGTIIFSVIIPIIISGVGAAFSYYFSNKNAEKAALRDYRYGARKRLYEEYEPLVFQFHQLCENAYERITDLAKNLEQERFHLFKKSENNKNSTYIANTVYRISAPLAMFKLMERRLTQFDLDLVDEFKNEYLFAKALFNVFREEEIPHQNGSSEIYRSQALHSADIDRMAEALLDEDKKDDRIRIRSLAEFTNCWDRGPFDKIIENLTDFHPDKKRVFWRNLLSCAFICRAICTLNPKDENLKATLMGYSVPIEDFFWFTIKSSEVLNMGSGDKRIEDIAQSLEDAKKYLQSTLKGPFGGY
jgi:hypothetical protein